MINYKSRMKYLGWALTNTAIKKNPMDSKVHAINNKGDSFSAISIDAAMRGIMLRAVLVSDCCGAREQLTGESEPLFDRYTSICGDCREHCGFVPEADYY